jgi:hypothetical protein
MGGRQMQAEHLTTPAAIQAGDMIVLNRSPDRNRRGLLDKRLCCRCTEGGKRLMDGRYQRGDLVRSDLITTNISGHNSGRDFSIDRRGQRLVGHSLSPTQTGSVPHRPSSTR